MSESSLLIGRGEQPLHLPLAMANRHGLIAGATGTGKTATLRVLIEGLSEAGVPVVVADVKGDLAGLAQPGESNDRITARAKALDLAWQPAGWPVVPWDVHGEQGHPLRSTVADFGPTLLARLLDLSEVQAGVLELAVRLADDEGLLLLDLADLRALLTHVADNAKDLRARYGSVEARSVGAIQRALLGLENQGAARFFGEPALELADLMRRDREGRGIVNLLAADKLVRTPKLYATVLLSLLAELFEELPEAGDLDRPKLVFFFDEAHLLFTDAPKALVEQVEQVVRLIRSKGVGVYFVTQNPMDIPESVLGQLGHRMQHALRAFTPADQKAVRAAARTFRANPKLDDVEEVLQQLGIGEALVSLLDTQGVPGVVERTLIAPPRSRLGPLTEAERRAVIAASPLGGRYDRPLDRDSAYERLAHRAERTAVPAEPVRREAESGDLADAMLKNLGRAAASSVGRQLGRSLVRGLLGSLRR